MNPHRSVYAPTIEIQTDDHSPTSRYRARRRGPSPVLLMAAGLVVLLLAGGAGFMLWNSDARLASNETEDAPVELTPPAAVAPPIDPLPAVNDPVTQPTKQPAAKKPGPKTVTKRPVRPVPPQTRRPAPKTVHRPQPPVQRDPVDKENIIRRPRVFGGRFDLSSLVAQADADEEAQVTGAIGILLPLVEIPEAAVKLPLPKPAETAAAVKLIRDVYRDEYQKAGTPLEKTNLARFLLKQAAETQEAGHERFAMLAEARDLALAGGSASTAMKMVDSMGRLYQFDAYQMKSDTLSRGAQEARSSDLPLHRSIAANSLVLVEGAVVAENYQVANHLLEIAVGSARKARDGDLVKVAASIRNELSVVETLHREAVAARTALANSSVDTEAHFKLGRYQCLVLGDWKTGLTHLAAGSHGGFRDAAKQDVSQPASGNEQARAGDLWWDLAQSVDFGGQALTERARHWYQLASASGQLAGLTKAKVASRLESIAGGANTPDTPVVNVVDVEENDSPLAKKLIGRFEVVATERRSRRRDVSVWEFRPSHEALENNQLVARWELLDLNQVKITYLDEARGVVFLKAGSNGPTSGLHTVSDRESWRWELSPLSVVAVWQHSEQSSLTLPPTTRKLRFFSNGRVNDPLGSVTWNVRGRRLTIVWDSMKQSVLTLSADGRTYAGETQMATGISGLSKVHMARGSRMKTEAAE